jgi:hypothetical protein
MLGALRLALACNWLNTTITTITITTTTTIGSLYRRWSGLSSATTITTTITTTTTIIITNKLSRRERGALPKGLLRRTRRVLLGHRDNRMRGVKLNPGLSPNA